MAALLRYGRRTILGVTLVVTAISYVAADLVKFMKIDALRNCLFFIIELQQLFFTYFSFLVVRLKTKLSGSLQLSLLLAPLLIALIDLELVDCLIDTYFSRTIQSLNGLDPKKYETDNCCNSVIPILVNKPILQLSVVTSNDYFIKESTYYTM